MSAVAVHLWQSTAFAVCAALLAWLLRRHEARTRHLIWMAASAKFLIPFDLLVGFGQQFAWRTRPIVSLAVGGTLDPTQIASSPLLTDSLAMPERLATPAGASTLQRVLEALPTLLPAVWLVGTLAMLGICLFRWFRICRMLQTATQLTDGREAGILHRAERAIGIRGVPLLRSTHQLEPAVVGCAEPVIVWPADISARMNDEQIEAILMHELAHVKRHDNLMGLVHMASQAAFWFNPLLWWIGARLVEERERACDEEVVRLGADPHEYAESILRTCEYAVVSPLPCVAGVTGADLKRRVRAIVHHTPAIGLSRATTALLTLAALSAAVVPIAAGALTVREVNVALPAPVPPRIAGTPARQLVTVALRREVRTGAGQATPPVAGTQTPPASRAAPIKSGLQSPPHRTFELVAIRPAPSTGREQFASLRVLPGGRFEAEATIHNLISYAFGDGTSLMTRQIIGLSREMAQLRFRISAKAGDEPLADFDTAVFPMLRSLLEDRFKLVAHTESRMFPGYGLKLRTAGRLGPKLRPSMADCAARQKQPTADLPRCGFRYMDGKMIGIGLPMTQIAAVIHSTSVRIRSALPYPVFDRTGLTGNFDFEMEWDPMVENAIPTLIQEQLGLRLELGDEPTNVVVIDHVEAPGPD
jgi:uncharacterized protein (TIGR03435 family)